MKSIYRQLMSRSICSWGLRDVQMESQWITSWAPSYHTVSQKLQEDNGQFMCTCTGQTGGKAHLTFWLKIPVKRASWLHRASMTPNNLLSN